MYVLSYVYIYMMFIPRWKGPRIHAATQKFFTRVILLHSTAPNRSLLVRPKAKLKRKRFKPLATKPQRLHRCILTLYVHVCIIVQFACCVCGEWKVSMLVLCS